MRTWAYSNISRRHGGTHVVGVIDSLIHDFSAGDMGDIRPAAVGGDNGTAGSCGGPLCRWGALAAVGDRHPVLPLGSAEMGGCHGCGVLGEAAVNEHSCHGKAFAHGGAGTIQSVEGKVGVPQREGRANALV